MSAKGSLVTRQSVLLPTGLFLVGLLLSAFAGYSQFKDTENNAKAEFERKSVRTEAEIATRFTKVVQALHGVRGLYEAGEHIEREEFRRYVLSLNTEREIPGVRGLGFIQKVFRPDLAAFIENQRKGGAPDFSFRQLTENNREDLFVITLIEPANTNKGAQGLDVGSEPIRRAGIQQAINTGAPAVTGSITLVQDNKKTPGMLLFVPIYRHGASIDTPAERREALVGVAYSPIVMAEILEGIPDVLTGMLDFEVFDSPIASRGGTLMFDADDHIKHLSPGADPSAGRGYSLKRPLDLPGRSITLSMNSTAAFDATINHTFPWFLFFGGAFISALLAAVLYQQANKRRQAEVLAQEMTTDLRAAQRDSEALLSTLNLYSIVSIADHRGDIIEINQAFCQISGYTRDELIGQNHRIVNSGAHPPAFWIDMWKTISTGLPWRGQVCNKAKDGHLYWVDTLVAPFIGHDGKIEKYISIRTDITSTKNAEEALRWSQSLMDKMSNSSPMGYLVVDNRSDEILYFNRRFCEIWGIGHLADRMKRKELKNNDIIPDCLPMLADVAAFAQSCKPLQTEDNRITLEDEISFTGQRTVRRFTTQIRDTDDQYYGRFYIFEDVTERKRAELELTAATEAAKTASLAKSQFLANMSHELRTPMNAILGMLALLRKTELTQRQADYAAKSEGAARALLGLLNEILDFSKIEAGKMTLDPHPFGVDQLLRDLSVILSTNVGEKPVEMLFDVDPTLPQQLVGDAMRLQQVLLNLGSNAIKFTERGEVVLSVRVLQRTDDAATLQFSMRDTGIGIAPENQARIFSGFTQAESSTTRRFGGTGLGVAISQRFVALTGGELELESALGEGSRFFFTVTLPIATDFNAQQRELIPTHANGVACRALVIDDNASARDVMEHLGESLGWQVDLAHSGEEALQMLQERNTQGVHYQAIFVDWTMPGMDGWQTIQHIREQQSQSTQPDSHRPPAVVVMVTAQGRESLSQRSQEDLSMLDGFLVKPVTASMLLDAIVDARSDSNHPHLSQETLPSDPHRLEGMRLLVVEDNPNNQQVARELLEDEGAQVHIANHGQEALDAIAVADPMFDAVLMDLQMPVMDGLTAARAIRSDLHLATLPIVAMTANAMASDRAACLVAGMNDHIGKPFDLNDLVRVLRRQAGWTDTPAPPEKAAIVLSEELEYAAEVAGVDLHAALQRLGGKLEVYQRMLQTFVNDLQSMPDQLHAAPRDTARRLLHTLKGLAATLGANALSTQAAALEKTVTASAGETLDPATCSQACEVLALALPGLQVLYDAMQRRASTDTNTTAMATPPVDRAALHSALQAMALMLEADDVEAMVAMATLQQQFGEALGEDLAKLEAAMAEMEFGTALTHCRALLEAYAA